MRKSALVWLVFALALAPDLMAQREEERNFFEQLRSLFGRFQEADLRRAFRVAQPVQCSQLVSDSGEWRHVAFFNEDRKLGAWYHRSLAEVNADLSVYTFKGECTKEQDSVQLVTRFPVKDSLDRYYAGRIDLKNVAFKTNAPVRATYNPRSESYRFELPYLYAGRGRDEYSLVPLRNVDAYVMNVINHWDCKSVSGSDVTFQFLICETATLPRNVTRGNEGEQSFGTYAYYILSDGKEARTSAKLSFGLPGSDDTPEPPPDRTVVPDDTSVEGWQIPAASSKLAEVDKTEFRIRFSAQTWADKIGSAQLLTGQKISTFDSLKSPTGMDYCTWRPAAANMASRVLGKEPDEDVSYTLRVTDTSIGVEMKTHNGTRLGMLQCFFTGADTAAVPFDKWAAVVGAHLTLEIRP
jgi:hypothetical protein